MYFFFAFVGMISPVPVLVDGEHHKQSVEDTDDGHPVIRVKPPSRDRSAPERGTSRGGFNSPYYI